MWSDAIHRFFPFLFPGVNTPFIPVFAELVAEECVEADRVLGYLDGDAHVIRRSLLDAAHQLCLLFQGEQVLATKRKLKL